VAKITDQHLNDDLWFISYFNNFYLFELNIYTFSLLFYISPNYYCTSMSMHTRARAYVIVYSFCCLTFHMNPPRDII